MSKVIVNKLYFVDVFIRGLEAIFLRKIFIFTTGYSTKLSLVTQKWWPGLKLITLLTSKEFQRVVPLTVSVTCNYHDVYLYAKKRIVFGLWCKEKWFSSNIIDDNWNSLEDIRHYGKMGCGDLCTKNYHHSLVPFISSGR